MQVSARRDRESRISRFLRLFTFQQSGQTQDQKRETHWCAEHYRHHRLRYSHRFGEVCSEIKELVSFSGERRNLSNARHGDPRSNQRVYSVHARYVHIGVHIRRGHSTVDILHVVQCRNVAPSKYAYKNSNIISHSHYLCINTLRVPYITNTIIN